MGIEIYLEVNSKNKSINLGGYMSIRDRVEDAEFLWNSNKKEGAWVQAMIATAATARKRYPKPLSDSQSFKNYIIDVSWTIFTGLPKPQIFKRVKYYSFLMEDRLKIFYIKIIDVC
jgi:hypothetical protein